MGVANWTSLGKNMGSVHVSGASGEVFRDFREQSLYSELGDPDAESC